MGCSSGAQTKTSDTDRIPVPRLSQSGESALTPSPLSGSTSIPKCAER